MSILEQLNDISTTMNNEIESIRLIDHPKGEQYRYSVLFYNPNNYLMMITWNLLNLWISVHHPILEMHSIKLNLNYLSGFELLPSRCEATSIKVLLERHGYVL